MSRRGLARTAEIGRAAVTLARRQEPRATTFTRDQPDEDVREGVALCYGKSHLLVALLRARGIPAGLCYQRLADEAGAFSLHGLVAVHLEGRWSRLDPRGNKPGVDAQLSLEVERLAWPVRPELGEVDYPGVLTAPDRGVVEALKGAEDMVALCGWASAHSCHVAEATAPDAPPNGAQRASPRT